MKSGIIAQILAGIVLIGAIVVMVGWILDIPVLKSILPIWVSMKFITAVCFLLSSIIVLILFKKGKGQIMEMLLIVLSFSLLLLMISFFFSLFTGISIGIESLFVKEAQGAVRTTIPGVPAVPTMLCFILIGLAGSLYSLNSEKKREIVVLGGIVALIGFVAVIGYLIGVPAMYYSFPGYTSMAFHTALFFVLLGVSLSLISREVKE
jgi:hypothetical protein